MVCLGDACIHPGQFGQMIGSFKLTHAAPFHYSASGVVNRIAGIRTKQSASQSGEDCLVHFSAVQPFQTAGNIKAGAARHSLASSFKKKSWDG